MPLAGYPLAGAVELHALRYTWPAPSPLSCPHSAAPTSRDKTTQRGGRQQSQSARLGNRRDGRRHGTCPNGGAGFDRRDRGFRSKDQSPATIKRERGTVGDRATQGSGFDGCAAGVGIVASQNEHAGSTLDQIARTADCIEREHVAVCLNTPPQFRIAKMFWHTPRSTKLAGGRPRAS